MDILLFPCLTCFLSVVNCYSDSESAESNRIEVTPFYDTIIYSDIADIINEFENNGISQLDGLASESHSDEKVEDLLSEYHHYLEKAHKQKTNYLEKTKLKNKVPLMRRDQFSKVKSATDFKHDFYFPPSIYNPSLKFSPLSFNNPLDVFIPINSKGKYMNEPELTTIVPKSNRGDLLPLEKIIFNEKKIMGLPPVIHKSSFELMKPPCFCKTGQFCKQCLIHMEPYSQGQSMKMHLPDKPKKSGFLHPTLYANKLRKNEQMKDDDDDNMKDSEHTLNVRIKIDFQLPKLQENYFGKYHKSRNHDGTFDPDEIISKELTTGLELPFPYFNFKVPMEVFGYKKTLRNNKDNNSSLHKITIHKRKKPKTNNNNKKHRKRIVTFHNIKLDPQPPTYPRYDDNYTDSSTSNNKSNFTIDPLPLDVNITTNKIDELCNETLAEEYVSSMVNISNITHNITIITTTTTTTTKEDNRKFENSIETDNTKMVSNLTTQLPIFREKREVSNINNDTNDELPKRSTLTNIIKKSDKNVLTDAELLYWPYVLRNESSIRKKNITTIILENEHKKRKLNMSTETIRQNHTRVLEQAIFGEVDWDDIDTVAPAFMSFVGKYVRGILTFCSQQVCHSMKCSNKTCLHRVCVPPDRLNNKGHCAGSNSTDSVASMESIMDLPSNIVFEIVDILQNKMLGKIFGKATFCINNKCITLVASKKTFVKTRCNIKELNTSGHCLNAKSVKIM